MKDAAFVAGIRFAEEDVEEILYLLETGQETVTVRHISNFSRQP